MAVPSSFDPLAATSLDHLHTLVQENYKIRKTLTKRSRQAQKQSSANCRQVELHNRDNWKTVAAESNESTCVQLHASGIN